MDKKKLLKNLEPEDLKGFEEFIEGQPSDSTFLPRGVGGGTKKTETGFEHFTFLKNDGERLSKLGHLLGEKLTFTGRFDQSAKLIHDQEEELDLLRKKMFQIMDKENSGYRKSLGEILDSYFSPPKA